VVSHDRYFLEKTTSSKLLISNNRIQKQLVNECRKRDDQNEWRLKLETERQEVLGKLSFMTPNSELYVELDLRFKELTKQINELKEQKK
jgi:macrolide transport system ATP-binding/permease protein